MHVHYAATLVSRITNSHTVTHTYSHALNSHAVNAVADGDILGLIALFKDVVAAGVILYDAPMLPVHC